MASSSSLAPNTELPAVWVWWVLLLTPRHSRETACGGEWCVQGPCAKHKVTLTGFSRWDCQPWPQGPQKPFPLTELFLSVLPIPGKHLFSQCWRWDTEPCGHWLTSSLDCTPNTPRPGSICKPFRKIVLIRKENNY